MGIYRGDDEYVNALHMGDDGPVWQVYNGDDRIWPPYGRLFGFDDTQAMHNIPPDDPSAATEVTDLGGTVNIVRGVVNYQGTLYAIKGDIIINPTQSQFWKIEQDGTATQIGVFPDNGTSDIDAGAGLAYDLDHNELYFFDRVATDESAIFRTAGTGTGGAFDDSLGTDRLIFANNQAALLSIDEHLVSLAYWNGYLYVVDAGGDVRRGRTGQAGLTLTDVGSLPAAADAMNGLTEMHGWMIGVDDSDQLWRWPPQNPASAVQVAGVIPSVTGELECLAYVPADEIAHERPQVGVDNDP